MTAWTGTGSPVTWTERVPQTTVTGTTIADGGFGFVATASGTFDDAKIGYDNNADNDLDDPGDDILYNEAYSVTSTSRVRNASGGSGNGASTARHGGRRLAR